MKTTTATAPFGGGSSPFRRGGARGCVRQVRVAVLAALAALLGAVAAAPGRAQEAAVRDVPGEDLPVVEHELRNGMRLLVLPRDAAPTVSFVTRFGVGSVHEKPGYTGIAHMLEHMLFKGTTSIGTVDLEAERAIFGPIDLMADSLHAVLRGPDPDSTRTARMRRALEVLQDSARSFIEPSEFDEILTRHGARDLNATTTYEATLYHVRLPANRTELWFVLEADRYRNPVFREFYVERDVVAEERRQRLETTGGGKLLEAFYDAAYRVHPYGAPVIGYMADIRGYTRDQVREYFDRYYRPNNAVVAIVGDVDPDEVIDYAEAYFGPIPPGEPPPPIDAVEPPQREERRVTVRFDAEPEMMIGWHVPDGEHPDAAPLSMLASVLAGGRTSRLHRRLVLEDRIAQSVTAFLGPASADPQLFIISAQPRAPHTLDEVEAAIYAELRRLAERPPTEDELQRVRNQIEAGEVRRLRSNLGLAFQLAESEAVYDDWRATFRVGRRLNAVTPDAVRRVARTYFRPENRTVARLVHEEDAPAAAEAPAGDSVPPAGAVTGGGPP